MRRIRGKKEKDKIASLPLNYFNENIRGKKGKRLTILGLRLKKVKIFCEKRN
jgi:hypothetical protein